MSTDFGVKVKVKLAERNMTMTKLAKILDISQPYLSDILHGRRKAENQKERICAALDIKEERGA